MCLRDNKHLDYKDSTIGAIQARLNDGPVYFQCYPNFMVRLRDAYILDLVFLHVKTRGFRFKKGNSSVSIITKFSYKSMTTHVRSRVLCTSHKGETILFQSNLMSKSNYIIPKKILWNEVEFPKSWHFSHVVPPTNQRTEKIEQIVQ